MKYHCHISGKYSEVAHNPCNLKLRINPKTIAIPVLLHNLRGYDVYHLMQAMSKQQKEVRCIANNMQKYISVTVGGLRFIDSLNFLQASLDSLVKSMPGHSFKYTMAPHKNLRKRSTLTSIWTRRKGLKKQVYQKKRKFYSKLYGKQVTDEEHEHG